MFDPEYLLTLEEGSKRNLMGAFATVGLSGIIEDHIQLLLKQTTQGYFLEDDSILVRKIQDTRLKVAMLQSLQTFCTQMKDELGEKQ